MKRAVIILSVLLVLGIAAGFYMGWFRVASDDSAGSSNITLTVDNDKIEADKDKAVDKIEGLGQRSEKEADATEAPELKPD